MATPEENQMEMMLEGGGLNEQGGTIDPVSGNEVPDGATQEGVRDDVPAMLSEGEYVMNEASTRYHGVDKLNAMQEEAKQGYNQMEKDGLMGQPTQGEMLDTNSEIPFGMGDINIEDDQGQELMMADGGLVPKGFYHGGMHDERGRPIQATSGMRTLNTQNQPNRPQPSFGDSMGGFGGFVFKNYQHPDGRNMMVPFMNGVPMFSIPEGFVPFDLNDPDAVAPTPVVDPTVTPAEVLKPVETPDGPDDPESGRPAGYDTMTPQEIFEFGNLLDKFPGGKLRDNWPGQRAAEQTAITQMKDASKKSDARKMADLNRLAQERKAAEKTLAEEKAIAQLKEENKKADARKAAELAALAKQREKKEAEEKQKIAEAQEFLRQDRLTREKIAADEARERALAEKIAADKKAEADAISYTLEQPDGGTSYTAPSTPTGGTAGYSGSYNEPGRGDGPDGPDGNGGGGGGSGGGGGGGNSGGSAGGGGGPYNKGGFVPKKPKKKMKTYKKGGLATR